MTALPVTSIFAAAAAIGLVLLSVPVTMRRIKVGVTIGAGQDDTLTRRIRAQGNFIEYVPLALLSMGLAELSGTAATLILVIGLALALGRALHAGGTLSDSTPLRGIGMILTYLALIGGAVCLLVPGIGR